MNGSEEVFWNPLNWDGDWRWRAPAATRPYFSATVAVGGRSTIQTSASVASGDCQETVEDEEPLSLARTNVGFRSLFTCD